jgi:hypothetical protein
MPRKGPDVGLPTTEIVAAVRDAVAAYLVARVRLLADDLEGRDRDVPGGVPDSEELAALTREIALLGWTLDECERALQARRHPEVTP